MRILYKTWIDAGDLGYLIYRLCILSSFIIRDRKRLVVQLDEMGTRSVPLVLIVGFFSGAIIAWQAAYQFRDLISLDVMGGQTSRAIVMEMGPVLTALVISGRLGASITAEIGAMRLSQQTDALSLMGIDPVRFLALPRVIALIIMMPFLTLFANFIAIFGAFSVSSYFLDMSFSTFFDNLRDYFSLEDFAGGLFKSFVFGLIIAIIGCFMGLSTQGGASGLGRFTVRSFVLCAVSVLISDYLLWLILF